MLAAVALLALSATTVLGHAALDTASPGPDETVTGSPAELVMTFTQNLDVARSALVVRDAAGTVVAEGGEAGDGPRELRLDLPELAPGEHEVRWTSWSAEDNEGERGTYTFTVEAAPAPTPTPSPSPTPEASATTPPTPSAIPTPAGTATPSPTPAATPAPTLAPAASDGSVLVPIIAALILLGGLGAWLLRRRSA